MTPAVRAYNATSEGWQRRCLKIIDKAGTICPLMPNLDQTVLENTLDLQRKNGLPVRAIVLKARQPGISTKVAADIFEDANRFQNMFAEVVSADDDSTDKIFKIYSRFQEMMPADEVKQVERSNRKEIAYSAPHYSSVRCQTAGKVVLGRSGTIRRLHCSELAFWRHAARQLAGLLQQVPDKPDTEVIFESTGCGTSGAFYERYQSAVERCNKQPGNYDGYLPIFLPWFSIPEYSRPVPTSEMDAGKLRLINDTPYLERDAVAFLASKGISLTDEQLYWRRGKIASFDGDLAYFQQEYPAVSREAFQATGRMVFAAAMLDKHETKCKPPIATIEFHKEKGSAVKTLNVLRSVDCWKVWKWPHPDHEYVCFGDVMEGSQADSADPSSPLDYHAAGILDRNTKEVVATFHGRCDTIPYGRQLVLASMFYNYAWASPEVNSCGLAVLNEFKRADYPNIYQRQRAMEEFVEEDAPQLGYKTTVLTRKPGIDCFKEVMRQDGIAIYDKAIIDECRTFIWSGGRQEGQSGYHDDWVLMMVGLIALDLQCPLRNSQITQQSTGTVDNSEKRERRELIAVANEVDTPLDGDAELDEDAYKDYGRGNEYD